MQNALHEAHHNRPSDLDYPQRHLTNWRQPGLPRQPKEAKAQTNSQIPDRIARKGLNSRKQNPSCVTELVFASPGHHHSHSLLLPMFSHLSHEAERWLTWIVREPVDTNWLKAYRMDGSKLRVLHCHAGEDVRWMFWEALSNGTSDLVVAPFDELGRSDIAHFEEAASLGQSRGIVVRCR